MKRLLFYDALIALPVLLLWLALTIVEIKVQESLFIPHILWGSVGLVFLGFPIAVVVALRQSSTALRRSFVALSFFCIAPTFVFLSAFAAFFLQLALGGGD